jgi:hypothetical protein
LSSKPVHHAEPETSAFARFLAGEKRLKRSRQYFRRYTRTGIGNLQTDKLRALAGHTIRQRRHERPHPQYAAFRHCVARINSEIDYGELELRGIGIDRQQTGREIGFDPDTAPDGADQQFGHSSQHIVEVEGGRP